VTNQFRSSHPEHRRLSAANVHLFQHRMTKEQKLSLLRLIDYCLKDFPFPYTLATGSLIGTYHFQGFVPWDDDFDINCFHSDQEAIKQALSQLPLIETFEYVSSFGDGETRFFTKIFFKEGLIDFPEYPWSWPFIDVFWLTQENEYVIVDEYHQKNYVTSDFFPLKTASFEERTLNIPNAIETVLTTFYPTCLEYAMPSSYDHLRECAREDYRPILVPFSDLKKGVVSPLSTLNQFPAHEFILVADIGATNSRLNLFDSVKTQLMTQTIIRQTPTGFDELERMLIEITAQMRQMLSDMKPGASISKAVLAVAGPVNLTLDEQVQSVNTRVFFCEDKALIDLLQSKLELPVSILNDTDAFLVGEVFYSVGSLYQEKKALGLTLGTGVGGSVIWDGKLLANDGQSLMEVGHMVYQPGGRNVPQPKTQGCWESYVSGEGLFETTKALISQSGDQPLKEKWSTFSQSQSNEQLFAAALAKEEWAQRVVTQWHEDLTYGLVTLMNIWGPMPVTLGGGLARWVNVSALHTHVSQKLIYHPSARQKLSIKRGTLGNDAGLLGAGLVNNLALF
jgi:glucokinase